VLTKQYSTGAREILLMFARGADLCVRSFELDYIPNICMVG